MQKKYVEYKPIVAPNLVSDTLPTVARFLNSKSVFLKSHAKIGTQEPAVQYTEEQKKNIYHMLYPENIKPFVSSNHKASDMVNDMLEQVITTQSTTRYSSVRAKNNMRTIQQYRAGTLQNTVITVADIEDFGITDSLGQRKNYIYNVAFEHNHTKGTIGKFQSKNNNFQHFFIGIYDKEEEDYLQKIADIVKEHGVGALDKDQDIAFEFFARIGDSITDSMDLVNKSADDIVMTKKTKEEFKTLDNFMKTFTGLKERGKMPLTKNGLHPDVERMIDNLAETIVNDNSIVTGWNVDHDISIMIENVKRIPNAESVLQKKIAKLRAGKPMEGFDIGRLRSVSYDPLHDMLMRLSGGDSKAVVDAIYQGGARDITQGMGVLKMENIAPAMAQHQNLPQWVRDIMSQTHHLGGIDVKQESHFILDAGTPLEIGENALLGQGIAPVTYDRSLPIKGLAFQAQGSGSMSTLQKYNEDVFAVVKSSNGDIFMSNGLKWDAKNQTPIRTNQFVPAAWSEGMTYELQGIDIIDKNSKRAQAIAKMNNKLNGQDLVRIEYKPAFLESWQQSSEVGLEKRYFYTTIDKAPNILGNDMRWIGRINDTGGIELNEMGHEMASHLRSLGADGQFVKSPDAMIFRNMNQMRFADRAERSFTKYSLATNSNLFMLQDIAKTGTFQTQGDLAYRLGELHNAIIQASKGNKDALNNIISSTNLGLTADKILQNFVIEGDGFNNAWLSNTVSLANTVQDNSMFKYLHNAALEILNEDTYKDISLSALEDAEKNGLDDVAKKIRIRRQSIYHGIVETMMEEYHDIAEDIYKKHPDYNNLQGRYVNDVGKFYVDATEFYKGFKSPYEVKKAGSTARNWLKINIDDPYLTMASISRATGLTGERALNERELRKSLLAFADFMSTNQDISKEGRAAFKNIFNKDLAKKSRWDIASDINQILSDLKRTEEQGWAPENIYRASESFFTQMPVKDPVAFQQWIEKQKSMMRGIAKEQYNMATTIEGQRAYTKQKIKEFILGPKLASKAEYAKTLDGFDKQTKAAMEAIYKLQAEAADTTANTLVDELTKSGIHITAGPGGVLIHHGSAPARNISALIPKLHVDQHGVLTFMLGDKNSRYVAGTTLHYDKKTRKLHAKALLSDVVEDKLSQGYVVSTLRARVEANNDPLGYVEHVLKSMNAPLREPPLSMGMPAADWRNFTAGYLTPILRDKEGLKEIIQVGESNKLLNETQKKAIADLKKHLETIEKGNTKHINIDAATGLFNLIAGENPIIDPIIGNIDGFILNAGAKQSSSDQHVRIGLTKSLSYAENHVDVGRGVVHAMDNALYIRADITDKHKKILGQRLSDMSFNPLAATAGEKKLGTITAPGGIKLTNRITVNALEADDRVKQMVYEDLIKKFKGDKTIADHFYANFMPYEGGGWVNGRIWDVTRNTTDWQKAKVTEGGIIFKNDKFKQRFENKGELRFKDTSDTTAEFTGYGRGIYMKKNKPLYYTYDAYNKKYRNVAAKENSVMSVVYTTKEGNQIVDAETLKDTVNKEMERLNLKKTKENWVLTADELYKRQIIAQPIMNEGYLKAGTDLEKHESVSGLRSISNYFSGDVKPRKTPKWMQEEKVLHDIFYSQEFEDFIQKDLGFDFRDTGTLNYDFYEDIASMKLNSAIFENRTRAKKMRRVIRNKMAEYKGYDPRNLTDAQKTKIKNEFSRMMYDARYRTSDAVEDLTGALFFARSQRDSIKHKVNIAFIEGTMDFLQKKMEEQRIPGQISQQQRQLADKQRAVDIMNKSGILFDKNDKIVRLSIDADGTIIYPTNEFNIREGEIEKLFTFDGTKFNTGMKEEEIEKLMFRHLGSSYKDVSTDAAGNHKYSPHKVNLAVMKDAADSDKMYKITDREINSYTNTLWDQELLNEVKASMGETEFNKKFGDQGFKIIDASGNLKAEYLGRAVDEDTIDNFFKYHGFMRFENGNLRGKKLFDRSSTKIDPADPYRLEKTKDLVNKLDPTGTAHISQEYADDLYEVASLQRAAAFNSGGLRKSRAAISEKTLISDGGKIADAELGQKQFFHKVHISKVLTDTSLPREVRKSGEINIYRHNVLLDLTNDILGLNNATLARTSIAVAAVDNSGRVDIAPTEYQKAVRKLQEQYDTLVGLGKDHADFQGELNYFNRLIKEVEDLQNEYADNKIKNSKVADVQSARVAGSMTHKVQVMSTELKESGFEAQLKGRTYEGKELIDYYKAGKKPNIAFITMGDLEGMGFNEDYFKRLKKKGISKDAWLDMLEKQGIQGTAHRWPSDYWGSSIAVQVYLNRNRSASPNTILYDDVTAAFLKADSDSDAASIWINGITDKKGRFIDTNTARLSQSFSKEDKEALAQMSMQHNRRMTLQIHSLNNMIKDNQDYRDLVNKSYDEYIEGIKKGTVDDSTDVVAKVLKGSQHVDLAGDIRFQETGIMEKAVREQYTKDFAQYRGRIADALDAIDANDIGEETMEWAKNFRNATSEIEAAGILQEKISSNTKLRETLYNGLGKDKRKINLAFRNLASSNDAQAIALQRLMKKGVGLVDTPFTAVEVLRQNAVSAVNSKGLSRQVITNQENAAMYLLKELGKEPMLTPKKMDLPTIFKTPENLEKLTNFMNEIFANGKNNPQLRKDFVDFMEQAARPPSSRYAPKSLLKKFLTYDKGKETVDAREVWGYAYDGMVKCVEDMNENSNTFRLIKKNVYGLARLNKGREFETFSHANTFGARLGKAISESNGLTDIQEDIIRHNEEMDALIQKGKAALKNMPKNKIQKPIRNFSPGKGLALSALGLAAAAVFGGYAGGNPARPAQQQAQEIQEQNPPPRNINLADPSLTTSNRKQPGYVININAQTERDKQYASQLITQAVTQNFKNTNVNVSMNVNQQPGNIGANDLVDYLTQAL